VWGLNTPKPKHSSIKTISPGELKVQSAYDQAGKTTKETELCGKRKRRRKRRKRKVCWRSCAEMMQDYMIFSVIICMKTR
jgi:hypothetical protein